MTGYEHFQPETIAKVARCRSVAELLELCPQIHGVSSGAGFWEGDADDLYGALLDAGWRCRWSKATYWWSMVDHDGQAIRYVEGDIYRVETTETVAS